MNHDEALRTLGLEEGATEADIKVAYKEMAQILHPDKFKGNKRLEERATEQFKRVNRARDLLLSNETSSRRAARSGGGGTAGGAWPGAGGWSGSGWPRGGSAGGWPGGGVSDKGRGASESYTWDDSTDYGDLNTSAGLKARLAGIAAAHAQLKKQLYPEFDRRRIGILCALGGIALEFISLRFIRFPLLIGLGLTLLIWGVLRIVNAQGFIKIIKANLKKLDVARKDCEEKLAELEDSG